MNRLLLVVLASLACGHGYQVTLTTDRAEKIESQLVVALQEVASSHGLVARVVAGQRPDGMFTSAYFKSIETRPSDEVGLTIVYSTPDSLRQELVVFIKTKEASSDARVLVSELESEAIKVIEQFDGHGELTISRGGGG